MPAQPAPAAQKLTHDLDTYFARGRKLTDFEIKALEKKANSLKGKIDFANYYAFLGLIAALRQDSETLTHHFENALRLAPTNTTILSNYLISLNNIQDRHLYFSNSRIGIVNDFIHYEIYVDLPIAQIPALDFDLSHTFAEKLDNMHDDVIVFEYKSVETLNYKSKGSHDEKISKLTRCSSNHPQAKTLKAVGYDIQKRKTQRVKADYHIDDTIAKSDAEEQLLKAKYLLEQMTNLKDVLQIP